MSRPTAGLREEMNRHRDTRPCACTRPQPIGRLGFDSEFFKLKKKGNKKEGNGIVKLLNDSGSASPKGAPLVLQTLFLH